MSKSFSNPCIRCGTERVVVKKWKEKVGESYIVTTETACPDADCQKKVDLENRRQLEKTTAMRLRSETRALQRKAMKDAERASKLKAAKKAN